MARPLADRLKSSRHAQFVGRSSELALFESTLSGNEFPFFVLHIHGPGGIGKTSLLNEFIYICERDEIEAVYLDARDVEPVPASFLGAVQEALQVPPRQSVSQSIEARAGRLILMIDTYEALTPLDNWLRTSFLPSLPDNVLTVLAGRNPPGPEWQSDLGWQGILRTIPLRNLSPKESRALLGKRGVPAEQQGSVLGFTHGHPLALSLIADLFAQRNSLNFRVEDAPDVVEALLQRFAQEMPDPSYRSALEVCALVRMTTESILQALLDFSEEERGTVRQLFDWLHGLSFIESGTGGLFPHDLAREVLAADLRWRNPDRWAALSAKARKYYSARLQQLVGQEQQNTLIDYVYLHRNNPVVRPLYHQVQTAQSAGSGVITDRYQETDRPQLLELVRKFEGETSARWAEFWLERQPDEVVIIRDGSGTPGGFLFPLALHRASEADLEQDPGTRAVMSYIKGSRPLRAGEAATLFRFWMARDSYQSISPFQILVGINMIRHYLTTPGLALSFNPCADPDFWFPILSYADLSRIPEADYEVDGRVFGVFGHDWRTTPPTAWLDLLSEREGSLTPQLASPKTEETLVVLSRADFEEVVRKALKAINQPSELQGNPLLRSRLVTQKLGEAEAGLDRLSILAGLIREAVESLNESPRDLKFYRVLYHTFVQPAPTQEQAAEMLNLPFPTYRYQLKIGVARVIEKLWQIELGMT